MNHQEAEDKVFNSEWKSIPCSEQNTQCWCAMIVPKEEIKYDGHSGEKDAEEYYIVGSGAINKRIAEYIVELHNKNINKPQTT